MTAREVKRHFWKTYYCATGKPRVFWGKSQNDLPCDVRATWVDFVDYMARQGTISEKVASQVTL